MKKFRNKTQILEDDNNALVSAKFDVIAIICYVIASAIMIAMVSGSFGTQNFESMRIKLMIASIAVYALVLLIIRTLTLRKYKSMCIEVNPPYIFDKVLYLYCTWSVYMFVYSKELMMAATLATIVTSVLIVVMCISKCFKTLNMLDSDYECSIRDKSKVVVTIDDTRLDMREEGCWISKDDKVTIYTRDRTVQPKVYRLSQCELTIWGKTIKDYKDVRDTSRHSRKRR